MSQDKNKYYHKYMKYKTKYLNFINGGNKKFQILSPDFENNKTLDEKYMYNKDKCTDIGENIFPTINWLNPPPNTKSFALIIDDKDAPNGSWIHLLCWNIPSVKHKLTNYHLNDKEKIVGEIISMMDRVLHLEFINIYLLCMH